MGGTTLHVVRLRQSARRPHFAAWLQTNYREQLGRREERQRPGSPASRRLSARRGPQAPGTRPPRLHDAQEEETCSCKSGNEAKKGGRKGLWNEVVLWINLQTRKCKQKGKGEQRESRPKWLTRKLKKIYLQKTEKLKMRVQPLMKQERKKPSLINIIYHVLSVVPVSLLVQSRGIFLSTIL
ncbi:non-histone chromosomal protein HMG-14 isoform X4 [Manis pentadactyla]|uniref:non-histone chromosomal protein HMG-14 isoform X4 n=1 Tax=Manis pentadactyla TaxID=143292 RepID=UPI00255C5726|nr:non-histone chromosomal protein HMG-14 isoform X4 [Manis pentadactyla]